MTAEQIARVCHEANRGYQAAVPTEGIPVAPAWDEFPEDQRRGVISGVELALGGATPEGLHQNWCAEKRAEGWAYGEAKDAEAKTHPCLVDYSDLPPEQRLKDSIFLAIVTALGRTSGVESEVDVAEHDQISVIEVQTYIDSSIRLWRGLRDGLAAPAAPLTAAEAQEKAPQYIDAYQSMRVSLLGRQLP